MGAEKFSEIYITLRYITLHYITLHYMCVLCVYMYVVTSCYLNSYIVRLLFVLSCLSVSYWCLKVSCALPVRRSVVAYIRPSKGRCRRLPVGDSSLEAGIEVALSRLIVAV